MARAARRAGRPGSRARTDRAQLTVALRSRTAEPARWPGRIDGSMSGMNQSKAAVRARVWQHLRDSGVGRGGIVDRIPDFVGSDRAARRLADMEQWQVA